MKALTLSAMVLAMAVLAASPTSAAPVHEYWVGTYDLRSDGFSAMLRIEYSPSHCDSGGCMWILVQSPGMSGDATVEHIDPDGSRLVFRLPNGAIADGYLVRGMPVITGTLDSPGNRRGFLAFRQGVSLASGRGGRGQAVNQDRLHNVARGTQSGPPPQFRGRVEAETERGGAQDSAQPVTLPDPPPGTNQDLWLRTLNDNLLKGISRLLNDDQVLVSFYLQEESQTPMTNYGRAFFRADFIQRLVPNLNR